jgi:hypothetical protein
MLSTTQRRGILVGLATLAAFTVGACHPDDTSSGGTSGGGSTTSKDDRTPQVSASSKTCNAKKKQHMHITASNLTPGIGYTVTLYFPSGGHRTISGTANSAAKGSYSFYCTNFTAGTVTVVAQNKMNGNKGKTSFLVVQAGSART